MAAPSVEVVLLASGLPAEFPPRAPVFSGKPEFTAALVLVSAALVEVAEGTLEVNGTSLPDDAPGYALTGSSSDWVPLATQSPVVERTLSSTCSTPLASRISAVMTRAQFTNTSPLMMVMTTSPPPRVGTVPLASVLL
jgi:hypothetical protein